MTIPEQTLPPLDRFPRVPGIAGLRAECVGYLIKAKISAAIADAGLQARRDGATSEMQLKFAQGRSALAKGDLDTSMGAPVSLAKATREADPNAGDGRPRRMAPVGRREDGQMSKIKDTPQWPTRRRKEWRRKGRKRARVTRTGKQL